MSEYRILGRVIDQRDRSPIGGLRVEAWDSEHKVVTNIGSATTDVAGAFTILLDDARIRELFGERKPVLYFQVMRGDNLIRNTDGVVRWSEALQDTVLIIEVDMRASDTSGSPQDRTYLVHGTVTGADGTAVAEAEIGVNWQHIRSRIPLATGRTRADGSYSVNYRPPANPPARVLIVVEARGSNLRTPLESALVEAAPDLQIDLRADVIDESEYATLVAGIKPLLDKLEMTDLVENDEHQDLSFLARELDKTVEDITLVALAARLEAAFDVPGAVLYAFLRLRVPSGMPSPLLDATDRFTLIEALVQRLGSLIFGLTADLQERTLLSAIDQGLIGPQYKTQVPKLVEMLQARRRVDVLKQPYVVGKASLGELLSVAQLPDDKHATFAQALTTNTQSMRGFWRTLGDGEHGFTKEEASSIQRTLSVGAFVKNHVPLIEIIQRGFATGTYRALPDLARLSLQDWVALVNQAGTPPSIDAAGDAPPAEVFARVVYARVTRAYPTMALSSRMASSIGLPKPQQVPVSRFFANNPSLELIKQNLAVYIETEGAKAFEGIDEKDRPTVVNQARRFQRVLKVAPAVDTAQTLLELGIDSATKIARMGRQQFFLKATAAGMTKREADRVYRAGAQRYAGAVSLYTQLNRDAIGIWPSAVGKLTDLDDPINKVVERDPSLGTLFGSQDYCEIDSCTSVLSPAAYVCDLLLWLRNHPQGGQTALDVLDARRPDIRHLLLNCPNSETALPYIDLVNELLADAISPPADPNSTINPPWKQTSANKTVKELRAAPEYFNQGAYITLFGATYPHTLPYSAGLDELRTYLDQSKIALWQVREALLPIHAPTVAQQAAVASERLGMAPREEDLVATPNFLTAPVVWNTATPATTLASVPAFMAAASISYESLLELLQSAWVQGGLNISIQGIDDTCDTSVQVLSPSPLDAGFLDRAHRFLRLWRRTGYRMWELDLLLRAPTVGNGTLDRNALIALQAFRKLADLTRLAVDQQLAFFQDIDTASHRDPGGTPTTSLYERTFMNPAVTSVAPDDDLAALPSGGAIAHPNLADHLPAIQAALGISGTDAATLFGLTDGQLTLANLSFIYRVNALAKAAKLKLGELSSIAMLLNPAAANVTAAITPLLANPAATLAFLAQTKSLQQSNLSIDALTYLLTPPAWTTTTQMTEAEVTTALEAVRSAMLNPSGGDVAGSVVAAVAANAHHAGDAPLANDVTAHIVQQLQVPGTGQSLLAWLTAPAIVAQPGGAFRPITPANFPNQFLAIQLLDKVGAIVRRLRLVAAELTWLLTNAASYGGLDFAALPVTAAQAPLAVGPLLTTLLLIQLSRLFTAAAPAAPIQTLYDLIAQVANGTLANVADTQAALASITGWPVADITAFATAVGVVFPLDYQHPETYETLRQLEAMAQAAGGTGTQFVGWGAVPADEISAEATAATALGALRARYPNNDDWLTLAPDIMDPIRERRSAALQSYLIGLRDGGGNLIYGDTNGLFDHFLIDVQMSSCEVSTRIIQAYIAIQIFVERCLMNLEAPAVVVDLNLDDTWKEWEWMKRYRIWEANRKVFLYPENWLIESQRPNRSEIYLKLEQDVHQNEFTRDNLESVVLGYVDGLEGVAHLVVTGTCRDTATGAVHVVGRSTNDPPTFYLRSLADGAWSGWQQIPLDIKAHQVVPTMYAGRICLLWLDVKVSNEPRQSIPAPQQSSNPPSQEVEKYVTLNAFFSVFRNGKWSPAQAAKGKLFDKPLVTSSQVTDARAIEALYSVKAQLAPQTPGYGTSLFVDVFRRGDYTVITQNVLFFTITYAAFTQPNAAVHIGRVIFDGRFSDVELRNLPIVVSGGASNLLSHAQAAYGADAQPLLPLPDSQADPDLATEPGLSPQAGALATLPSNPGGASNQTLPLTFTSVSALEQGVGPLLNSVPVPFRVVGPAGDLNFDPTSYFFLQDSRRCFYVESQRYYWTGSAWSPVVPSNPSSVPFEVRYVFHRFYHPFTRLLWHQLGSGGFPLFYDRALQLHPDTADPSGGDVFTFHTFYQPVGGRTRYDRDDNGEDREFLDFKRSGAYALYNWELFFHIPLYVAELLSQNQKFSDALEWFHYIFNPTRPGPEPAPKRFWIPKPLYELTSSDILAQRINNLLVAVDNGDPAAIAEVRAWRKDPFNPFLLADQRPVAYMKRTVMSYLDNLIAWADNLFASDSREALSEATLLYVIASEILGPQPAAIEPPKHADDSYDQLEPKLDAFANAMVDIENALGGAGGGGGGGDGGGMPPAHTFYFKIPPNDKLLGYWTTIADRLFKLRHCQNIAGVTRSLALFDAPIDPGLLIKARAAGVDIGSVLSDLTAPLPNYRFTALYSQALDFVNAVRAYGTSLLSAIEKSDAAALTLLQQSLQQQLLRDGDQIFEWQAEQAQNAIDNLTQTLALAQSKYDFNSSQSYMNAAEIVDTTLSSVIIANYIIIALGHAIGAIGSIIPDFMAGAAGFGGSPTANVNAGGGIVSRSANHGADAGKAIAASIEKGALLAAKQGQYGHRQDSWNQAAAEAQIAIQQANIQLASAQLSLQIAQQNQANHQEQIDNIDQQVDFLTNKFTSKELYDWQVGQLSTTYFQSYKLAYRLCKQVESCYRFELGIPDSDFIQFGYWDSLRKGLLAGEQLNHDLRRMQASYLEENKRRYEISRFISLGALNPTALQQLLATGACDFDLPEALFDNDYPGHYNRRLVRASVTVVYPSPGKFDNVKATLTLTANKVRTSTDIGGGYGENPVGADPRFVYAYAAVPQRIVLGNAQDDPGLFLTAIANNISDPRYLPFENAGAVSSWHFEMPAATNEIDITLVGDVVLHLHYTALDGGDGLKAAVQAENTANVPTTGIKVFSALNDFGAPAATAANPSPLAPWQGFLAVPAAGADQVLTLSISALKFPPWTRGKTISVTGISLIALAWPPGDFVVRPQAPLPTAAVPLAPVAGSTTPTVCSGTIAVPPGTPLGTWSFKIRTQDAPDFRSITRNDIGDVLVLVNFQVS
jgi:hypothetical protein